MWWPTFAYRWQMWGLQFEDASRATMRGSVPSAAGLVWRHQRLLWWIFVLNLALAWLSSLVVRAITGPVLDTSFESAKLVTGFDVSTLVLLLEQPEVPTQV